MLVRGGEKKKAYNRFRTDSKDHLLFPGAVQPCQHVRIRNVLDANLVIFFRLVRENDAIHNVDGSRPTLVAVVEDALDLGLGTRDVALLTHCDVQAAPEEATEVRIWMCELVGLLVALLEGDEDAEVVLAGHDFDARAGKPCRELVEAFGAEAPLGTADVEGRDGWMVRGLFCKV